MNESGFDRKNHWNRIYRARQHNELSWFQSVPETSLRFIELIKPPESAKIIDIGGGESFFSDHLLQLGYGDITVLDISESAIEKTRSRLGTRSRDIKWVATDLIEFESQDKFDVWHDRATFHFLTNNNEIDKYREIVHQSINPGGYLIIGTFSVKGPENCSGLSIKQYSEQSLTNIFRDGFVKEHCFTVDHVTPSGSVQNFIFCSFRRKLT